MAWTQKYLMTREIKIMTDDLLSPYLHPKSFMKSLDENLAYLGIILAIGEVIFNGFSRKYEKRTILHVYKIDIITIKILNYVHTLHITKNLEK